jgi:catechol-2,3-dioxygenase
VTLQTADGRLVTWCYLTDPEGNIIELQSWSAGR